MNQSASIVRDTLVEVQGNRDFQSVIFNSSQKMALRAVYVVIFLELS